MLPLNLLAINLPFRSLKLSSVQLLVVIPTCALLLVSCGDRKIDEGRFIDAAVENLRFSSEAGSGFTDEAGTFIYRGSNQVEFTIGNLSLGSTIGDNIVSPINLVVGGSLQSEAVINRAILLQSLDADDELDNGIQIPAAAHTVDTNNVLLQQSTAQFTTDPNTLIFVRNAKNDQAATLVSATSAQDNLAAALNEVAQNSDSGDNTITATASPATAQIGDLVTLTGTIGPDIVMASWREKSTNAFDVMLTLGTDSQADNLTDLQASFVAPQVSERTNLEFEFIGETGDGQTIPFTVSVTININGTSNFNDTNNTNGAANINGVTNSGFNQVNTQQNNTNSQFNSQTSNFNNQPSSFNRQNSNFNTQPSNINNQLSNQGINSSQGF